MGERYAATLAAKKSRRGSSNYSTHPGSKVEQGGDGESENERVVVHVVTKVWYTHLGYERTKLSVKHSFEQLREAFNHPMVDLRLHVMLHWPRCYNSIEFMNCQEDEDNLPDHVRMAGPPPHEDRENAWKHSWRALEDLYLNERHNYPLESIGLSNFNYNDLIQIQDFARMHPHVLQLNVWSLIYDPHVVEYCETHNVHVQVYNALSGIVTDRNKAPKAYHHLQKVSSELTTAIEEENGNMENNNNDNKRVMSYTTTTTNNNNNIVVDELSPAQTVLAWLIQHGVGVVPRTSRLSRLSENSAVSLVQVPELNNLQVETVAHCVEAFLSGNDLEEDVHVSVTFHAPQDKDVMIFWNGFDGKPVHIAYVAPGDRLQETTYPNHSYRLYYAQNMDVFVDYKVNAKLGQHENVHIEL